MRHNILKATALAMIALTISACSKGGELVLEPTARKNSKGSPFVSVNQGGKAYISSASGHHATVTIQATGARNLSSTAGHSATINKAQ